MLSAGPVMFAIPPGDSYTATGTCEIDTPTRVLAAMPHMHQLGTVFEQRILRRDGAEEPLIRVSGWSYEMQPFYQMDALLEAGDRVTTSCTWRNPTDEAVYFGFGANNEMCFSFMFVSPPPRQRLCN